MQPKVSLVVSCYNKVNYISGMLDSVVAQKWDNLEIILVNDGSTDGTRVVIGQYEEKLKARGYEVTILDQGNQGVAAAVRNGLMLVTGEFVCIPDCDDLLHEEYVSAMVKALNQFSSVNCVVCDDLRNRWDLGYAPEISTETSLVSNYNRNLLTKFFMGKLLTSVAVLMFRASLIYKLHLIETFITNLSATQEPQIWLPILASEDAIIHLRRPLYSYIVRENSIVTSQTDIHKLYQYAESRCILSQNTLESCIGSKTQFNFYSKLATISKYAFMVRRVSRSPHLISYKEYYTNQFVRVVNDTGLLPLSLDGRLVEEICFSAFFYAVSNFLTNCSTEKKDTLSIIRSRKGRLIAYGAGFVAKSTLEDFIKCNIVPNEVWDIKAQQGDRLFGIPLMFPDFGLLSKDDTVILFLNGNQDVERKVRKTEANVFYFHDVLNDLGTEYFPELIVNHKE
ncbi:glycosyltransferase family 2 protein [Paenibacillus soyae]|nr:glycosyltransferase [Paenibacillus soyae]